MRDQCLLAKAVVVSGDALKLDRFKDNYVASQNMYVFPSVAVFDITLGLFTNVRLMHDKIIRQNNIPELPDDKINFITVDIKSDDRTHTYLSYNRRGLKLSENQLSYLKHTFSADY